MQFTSQTGHIHTSRPIWPLRIFVLVQFGSSCPVGPAACINVPVPSILRYILLCLTMPSC